MQSLFSSSILKTRYVLTKQQTVSLIDRHARLCLRHIQRFRACAATIEIEVEKDVVLLVYPMMGNPTFYSEITLGRINDVHDVR